jgi:hypothetical protein
LGIGKTVWDTLQRKIFLGDEFFLQGTKQSLMPDALVAIRKNKSVLILVYIILK